MRQAKAKGLSRFTDGQVQDHHALLWAERPLKIAAEPLQHSMLAVCCFITLGQRQFAQVQKAA